MIPSVYCVTDWAMTVYQRGWMIDSQPFGNKTATPNSISKGMDD